MAKKIEEIKRSEKDDAMTGWKKKKEKDRTEGKTNVLIKRKTKK